MSPLKPDTARMLAALMKKIDVPNGIIVLTREEIEDAPEIEMKELFDTDEVLLRLSK